MKQLIGYCRVSTDRQKSSRNGLESQQQEIRRFAEKNGYELVMIVEEGVSGKYGLKERPVLNDAVELCLKTKTTLVVSKLDRLSRNAAFIMTLMETKLKFVVAELGEDVSPFMLHIHCVVAEQERVIIGKRTKDALAAKKAREPQWTPGNRTNIKEASKLGGMSTAKLADAFAARLRETVEPLFERGDNLSTIAAKLNRKGEPTPRGGQWTAQSVCNLRKRWN